MKTLIALLAFSVLPSGCGEARTAASPTDDAPLTAAGCEHFELEADFEGAPLIGPEVRGGELAAGEYIISSTYLQLREEPAAREQLGELMRPIMADLMARDGLLALSFGDSKRCGTARTLAVWRDDAAMFSFVTGEAHNRAIEAVEQLSRGGSVVMHWTGDASAASWASAMNYLAEAEGPFY